MHGKEQISIAQLRRPRFFQAVPGAMNRALSISSMSALASATFAAPVVLKALSTVWLSAAHGPVPLAGITSTPSETDGSHNPITAGSCVPPDLITIEMLQ
jgi:hypothetical protein